MQNGAYWTEKTKNTPSQNMSKLSGKGMGKLDFVASVWHQPGHFDHSLTPYICSRCTENLFSLMICIVK